MWLNLNSLLPAPAVVSATYLSLYLAQLRQDGYSVFECTATGTAAIDTAGDVNQCDPSRWHSLRSVLSSSSSSSSSSGHFVDNSAVSRERLRSDRGQQQIVVDNEDDDERVMQAAIQASMQDVPASYREAVDEDAELRAAIVLSMSSETRNAH